MKKLTHTDIQEAASVALRRAMKEGVAHETRQVGDDIQITTVVQQDVEGTVLAVSYPDGGIDYYPTEISQEEQLARVADKIRQLGEIMSRDGRDANILTAEEIRE